MRKQDAYASLLSDLMLGLSERLDTSYSSCPGRKTRGGKTNSAGLILNIMEPCVPGQMAKLSSPSPIHSAAPFGAGVSGFNFEFQVGEVSNKPLPHVVGYELLRIEQPRGTVIVTIGGKVGRILAATREILGVFEVEY